MHPLSASLYLAAVQVLRQGAAPPGAEPLTMGNGPDLGWLMGVVAALVLAIAGLAVGFRKVVLGTMKTRAARRDLQVLDMLPLGGKRQLAVVRCYDRTFALGLGEKDVALVAELDRDAVEHDREQRQGERSEAFVERLAAARERLLGSGPLARAAQAMGPAARAQDPVVEPAAAPARAEGALPRVEEALGRAEEIQPREVAPRAGSTKEFVA